MRSVSLWSPRRTSSLANFDDFFSGFDGTFNRYSPAIDIEEKDETYFMTVDLPGMKKEDIHINLQDQMLTISGERTQASKGEGRYQERSYGSFQRSFSLPHQVDAEKIEAKFEDGVLHLALPKSEAAKARAIKIQ